MTRARGVRADSTPPLSIAAPVLPSTLASVPAIAESEEEALGEDEAKLGSPVLGSSDSETESEQEAEFDEEAFLLQEEARLMAQNAALKAERVARLRLSVGHLTGSVAARLAEKAASIAPAVVGAAAAVVDRTPVRSSLRPRELAFHSTVGRQAPSPAALAKQASIDALVDVDPTVASESEPFVPAGGAPPSAVASGTSPRPPPIPKPEKFTGDDPKQNERVENWVGEVDRWLGLYDVTPYQLLVSALSFLDSRADSGDWLKQRKEELAYAGEQMTWEWLKVQLIQHYAQPSGVAAVQAEWQMLRMGVRAEGTDAGESTRTVKAYTNRFLHYLRRLTDETAQTHSILVIDRYMAGIRSGYEALYKVMLGFQPVLRFGTLQEAIDAAEIGEVDIGIRRTNSQLSSPSVGSSTWSGRPRSEDRGAATETLNNLQQGEDSDEGETDSETASPPPRRATKKSQLYVFQFNPDTQPKDGRYVLTKKEGQMLTDERRCWRCHQRHPTGRGAPLCTNRMPQTPPKSMPFWRRKTSPPATVITSVRAGCSDCSG